MARKEIRDGRTVYIPGNAPDKFFYSLSKAQRYERTCGGWAAAKAGKPTKRGSLVKSGGLGRGYSGDLSAAHKAAKVGRARNARGQFVGLADTPVGPQDELLIVVGNEAGVLLYLYEMWLDDGDQGGYVLAESAPHRSGKLQIKKRGKVEPHGDPAPLFEKLRKLATPAPEWWLNRLDTGQVDLLMGKGYSASLAEGFSDPP